MTDDQVRAAQARGSMTTSDSGRSGKCEWCAGSGSYHVGAGNYWSCPICRDRRLHWIERQRIERRVRPLPPGWQEALDRDEELRRAS